MIFAVGFAFSCSLESPSFAGPSISGFRPGQEPLVVYQVLHLFFFFFFCRLLNDDLKLCPPSSQLICHYHLPTVLSFFSKMLSPREDPEREKLLDFWLWPPPESFSQLFALEGKQEEEERRKSHLWKDKRNWVGGWGWSVRERLGSWFPCCYSSKHFWRSIQYSTTWFEQLLLARYWIVNNDNSGIAFFSQKFISPSGPRNKNE